MGPLLTCTVNDFQSKVQGLVIGFFLKLSLDSRGKKDLDCSRVRVHHKPTRKTNPRSECHWVKVQSDLFPWLLFFLLEFKTMSLYTSPLFSSKSFSKSMCFMNMKYARSPSLLDIYIILKVHVFSIDVFLFFKRNWHLFLLWFLVGAHFARSKVGVPRAPLADFNGSLSVAWEAQDLEAWKIGVT